MRRPTVVLQSFIVHVGPLSKGAGAFCPKHNPKFLLGYHTNHAYFAEFTKMGGKFGVKSVDGQLRAILLAILHL